MQFGAVDSLIKPRYAGGANNNNYNSTYNDFTWWEDSYGEPYLYRVGVQ